MSNFTPGPWTHRNGRIFQTDYEQLTIANVGRAFNGDYSPANGDLLTDAPALLDALSDLLAYLEDGLGDRESDEGQQARVLIAKHMGVI